MDKKEVDFTEPWPHSDVVFVVEEKKIYVNKAVLSMCSPVMDSMFNSDWKVNLYVKIKIDVFRGKVHILTDQ